MTRELLFLVTGLVALGILLAMFFAWRRRLRRDAGLSAPLGVPEHAEVHARYEVLYVSTTRHDEPLERLTISPLAYRARGELAVTDRGVALCLDGAPTVFLSRSRLQAVDSATVTIDRVVEPGGLIKIVWDVADAHPVDSYLRVATGDPAHLISELRPLIAAPKTGATS
ncbi:PH-like domain-containing protein [Microbacterium sp. GXF0217]